MLSGDERRLYMAARDQIDKAVRSHGPQVNDAIKTLAYLRAKKEYFLVEHWLEGLADINVNPAGFLLDVDEMADRLVRAYVHYFRIAFSFRFAFLMAHNINFRKIISFEYHSFARHSVFSTNARFQTPGMQSLKQDQKLFYTNPQSHFFTWRILKEISVTVSAGEARRHAALIKLYDRLHGAMAFFPSDQAANDPDALRKFLETPLNQDILQFVDQVDQRGDHAPLL